MTCTDGANVFCFLSYGSDFVNKDPDLELGGGGEGHWKDCPPGRPCTEEGRLRRCPAKTTLLAGLILFLFRVTQVG